MIAIICIVCITVIVLFGMYIWWKWKNSYIDEIYTEGNLMKNNVPIGKLFTFKRTYKNGTIKYIRKTLKN